MQVDAEARLAKVAATQHGVFTVRDAHQVGVTDRVIRGRVQRGVWIRLHPKVLCHASRSVGLRRTRRPVACSSCNRCRLGRWC